MSAANSKGGRRWEYPKGSKIFIREIINLCNGQAFNGSYLVTVPAKLVGTVRKRRQFKDKAKAEKWASKEFRGSQKQGEDYFKATDDERRQFIEVLPRLREKGVTLQEVLDFALPRIRTHGGDKTIGELVKEMIASKETRYEQGELRYHSVKDFRIRSKRFSGTFGEVHLKDITAAEIKNWLQSLNLSQRSRKNFLAVISEIFRHAKQSKLVFESPLDDLTDMDRKELHGRLNDSSQPEILSVKETELLLNAADERRDLGLLPVLALGLFCGLRTEEIKLMDWKHIHLDADSPFVTVGAEIAKKRRIRNVDIPENAVAWLTLCREESGKIIDARYMAFLYRRLHELLAFAGIGEKGKDGKIKTQWGNNAMRHSFGTYHFALHGNSLETARLLGHKTNDQVLFDHYRALTTKQKAEAYFSISPPMANTKIIEFRK